MTHKVGDIVTPNPDAGWSRRMIGTLYKVTALPIGARGVNYKASPCDADGNLRGGQALRGPEWALLKHDKNALVVEASRLVLQDYVPNHPIGAIVLSEGPARPEGFYVVIGETDATRVRIVQIGDTSGRYYRATSTSLTALDAHSVKTALAAGALPA